MTQQGESPTHFYPGSDTKQLRTLVPKSLRGFSVAELVVATALITLIAVGAMHSFLVSNRIAAANRVMTAARTIVQRNLDNALSLRWDTSENPDGTPAGIPDVLTITPAQGTIYDDDGVADSKVAILVENNGSPVILLYGTLKRIVTKVDNPQNADIRRITFQLSYRFQNRDMVVQMSTMRAIDD